MRILNSTYLNIITISYKYYNNFHIIKINGKPDKTTSYMIMFLYTSPIYKNNNTKVSLKALKIVKKKFNKLFLNI